MGIIHHDLMGLRIGVSLVALEEVRERRRREEENEVD